MLNVSANCSSLRPVFGQDRTTTRRKVNTEELLDDVTNTVKALKSENMSEERKAEKLTELSDKITKDMNPASPFKTVIATAGVAGAGALLGRKMFGTKVLGLLDKNTKVVDFLSKKFGQLLQRMSEIKPSADKTFKGFISRNMAKVSEALESFSKKGLSKEVLSGDAKEAFASISKNGATKAISVSGAIVGGVTGAGEVLRDSDGNGQSDALEKANKLSTIEKMDKFLNAAEAFTGLAS